MKIVLVDSCVIIDFLRQKNKEETSLLKLVKKGVGLKISILTVVEMYAGKSVWEKAKAKRSLEEILDNMEVLSLSKDVGIKAGKIKAETGIDLVDAIIASTARENKIELATLNLKHFEKVAGLQLYDWVR